MCVFTSHNSTLECEVCNTKTVVPTAPHLLQEGEQEQLLADSEDEDLRVKALYRHNRAANARPTVVMGQAVAMHVPPTKTDPSITKAGRAKALHVLAAVVAALLLLGVYDAASSCATSPIGTRDMLAGPTLPSLVSKAVPHLLLPLLVALAVLTGGNWTLRVMFFTVVFRLALPDFAPFFMTAIDHMCALAPISENAALCTHVCHTLTVFSRLRDFVSALFV